MCNLYALTLYANTYVSARKCERTGNVVSVACLFCHVLGRQRATAVTAVAARGRPCAATAVDRMCTRSTVSVRMKLHACARRDDRS